MPHAPFASSAPRSSLPGALLLAYVVALVYGSLYPASNWRASGLPSLAFLFEPWPRYWTTFDVVTNVAVYVAPAALAQVLLARRVRPTPAVVTVIVLASALSLLLETAQGFLPARVPSRLDWLANTGGAAIGAIAVALWSRAVARSRWSLRAPMRWSAREHPARTSASGLTLLAAWLALQLYPQRLLFGNGDVVEPLLRLWSTLAAALVESTGPSASPLPSEYARELADGIRLNADYTVLAEASGTAAAIVAIGLLVREIHASQAPRTLITIATLAGGAVIHSASTVWVQGVGSWLGWLTAGAQGGIVVGTVILAMLASTRRKTRLLACVVAIAATAVLTSVFPHDPYYASAVGRWDAGVWRNFTGLTRGASLLWPALAIGWCLVRIARMGGSAGSIMFSQR